MRRALLVGLNTAYGRPSADLRGCGADVDNVHRMLLAGGGYRRSGIKVLLDHGASKAAIFADLGALIAESKPGDVLGYLHSSHGTQLPDDDGDERDGYDEALCCAGLLAPGADFAANCIRDDELREIIATVPRGVLVWTWFDTCHSGTATRLADLPGAPVSTPRFLPYEGRDLVVASSTFSGGDRALVRVNSMAEILFAGCRAYETSADALIESAYAGAMTHHLVRELERNPKRPIRLAHTAAVRALRRARYAQTPQLEGSRDHLDLAVEDVF